MFALCISLAIATNETGYVVNITVIEEVVDPGEPPNVSVEEFLNDRINEEFVNTTNETSEELSVVVLVNETPELQEQVEQPVEVLPIVETLEKIVQKPVPIQELPNLPDIVLKHGNSDYEISDVSNETFDLEIVKETGTGGVSSEAVIENVVREYSDNITLVIGSVEEGDISTEIFAVEEDIVFDRAIISLRKHGPVERILHCVDFDVSSLVCRSGWEPTDILFTEMGDVVIFAVSHFTGYAGGGGNQSSLVIFDDNDPEGGSLNVTVGSNVFFFANYTNTTSGIALNDSVGWCNVSFNVSPSGPFGMVFNGSSQFWEFNRSFSVSSVDWNVVCNASSYEQLDANDSLVLSVSQFNIDNCTNITSPGYYVITSNISIVANETCINVLAENVTLDCAGHSIAGDSSGWASVFLHGSNNSIIENCVVMDSSEGIYVRSADNITVRNNTVYNISYDDGSGIYIHISNNSLVENNRVSDTSLGIGITIDTSDYNIVRNNFLNSNKVGIFISSIQTGTNLFHNNTVTNNLLYGIETDNSRGVVVQDSNLSSNVDWDLFSYSDSQDMNFGNISVNNNHLSFIFSGMISIKDDDGSSSPDPSGYQNISHYLNMTNSSDNSWILLNWSYQDSDLNGINESTLFLARFNGSWETDTSQFANNYGVDSVNNVVYANISQFSIFAILGNATYNNTIPSIDYLILNSTFGTNYTNENLSAYPINVSPANASIIYNWFVNNQSLMIANLPFGRGSNSTFTRDYSPFSLNGSVYGSLFNSTSGHNNTGAFDFDGADDYIELPNTNNFLDNLTDATFSLWVYHRSNATDGVCNSGSCDILLFKYDHVYYIAIASNGKIESSWGDGSGWPGTEYTQSAGIIPINNWTHIAVVKQGTNIRYYINGQLDSTASEDVVTVGSSANGLVFGKLPSGGGGTSFYDGLMDTVSVYNRSLSSAQIRALYEDQNDLVVSQELLAFEVWHSCATPNDGLDGNDTCSNDVAINEIPRSNLSIQLVVPDENTSSLNFTQYDWFEVVVNVSCLGPIDCGAVDVSLDPEASVNLTASNVSADVKYGSPTTGPNGGGQIQWVVPTDIAHKRITNATLCFHNRDSESSQFLKQMWLINESDVWDESSSASTLNSQQKILGINESSSCGTAGCISCHNVTALMQKAADLGYVNVTFRIEAADTQISTINSVTDHDGLEPGTYWVFDDREQSQHLGGPMLNISYSPTKGLISNVTGAAPFYTNDSNPRQINLTVNQSQLVSFWVNGTTPGTYSFFAYANRTVRPDDWNETRSWNVTVLYDYGVLVDLLSPADNFSTADLNNVLLSCNASAYNGLLSNITLYDSSTGWSAVETLMVNGSSAQANFTRDYVANNTFVDTGFVWNCFAEDNRSRSAFADANWSFSSWGSGTIPSNIGINNGVLSLLPVGQLFNIADRHTPANNNIETSHGIAYDNVSGRTYYVWSEDDGTVNQIWIASLESNNTGWNATQLTNSTSYSRSEPDIGIAGSTAYVAYRGYDDVQNMDQLWLVEWNISTGNWTTLQLTNYSSENVRYPRLVVDEQDSMVYFSYLRSDDLWLGIYNLSSGNFTDVEINDTLNYVDAFVLLDKARSSLYFITFDNAGGNGNVSFVRTSLNGSDYYQADIASVSGGITASTNDVIYDPVSDNIYFGLSASPSTWNMHLGRCNFDGSNSSIFSFNSSSNTHTLAPQLASTGSTIRVLWTYTDDLVSPYYGVSLNGASFTADDSFSLIAGPFVMTSPAGIPIYSRTVYDGGNTVKASYLMSDYTASNTIGFYTADWFVSANGTFISKVFNNSALSEWKEISYSASVPSNTSIYLEYRTSDELSNWSSWNNITNLSSVISKYLQYRAVFSNFDAPTATPDLEWVRINFSAYPGVTVILNHPFNNNNTMALDNVTFNCSAIAGSGSYLTNISLYSTQNGSWQLVETQPLSGTYGEGVFNFNLVSPSDFRDRGVSWNCIAYNNYSMYDWGDENFAFSSWENGNLSNVNIDGRSLVLSSAGSLPVDEWVNVTQTSIPPLTLRGALVYDPITQKLVYFGGLNMSASNYPNFTWNFDYYNRSWFDVTGSLVNAPDFSDQIKAAGYDSSLNLIVAYARSSTLGDMAAWYYNNSNYTWSYSAVNNIPDIQDDRSTLFDSADNQFVILANSSDGNTYLYFYNYSSDSWSNVSFASGPQIQRVMGSSFDSDNGIYMFFGGSDSESPPWVEYNETWVYNKSAQTLTNVSGAGPSARTYMDTLVYDPERKQTVLYGGAYYSGADIFTHNDTWFFNSSSLTWTEGSYSSTPPGVGGGVMAFVPDPDFDAIIIIAGFYRYYPSNNSVYGFNYTYELRKYVDYAASVTNFSQQVNVVNGTQIGDWTAELVNGSIIVEGNSGLNWPGVALMNTSVEADAAVFTNTNPLLSEYRVKADVSTDSITGVLNPGLVALGVLNAGSSAVANSSAFIPKFKLAIVPLSFGSVLFEYQAPDSTMYFWDGVNDVWTTSPGFAAPFSYGAWYTYEIRKSSSDYTFLMRNITTSHIIESASIPIASVLNGSLDDMVVVGDPLTDWESGVMRVDNLTVEIERAFGEYVSQVFDASSSADWLDFAFDASLFNDTNVSFQSRIFDGSGWSSWADVSSGILGTGRLFQYKGLFSSSGSFKPALNDVEFNFSSSQLGGWSSIMYPEGVYEPYNSGLPGTHLHTFFIRFVGLNASVGDWLECPVQQSDGSVFFVNRTVSSTQVGANYSINYTLNNSDIVSKLTPWQVVNCSLYSSNGSVLQFSDSAYGSRLNKSIFVHNNTWSRFNSVDDDAYRASRCLLGIPKRYFNNSYYCDYVGDVSFAVSMSTGFAVEGYCHDELDNDGTGQADCADRYCRGIPYTCIPHSWAGDPFEGTCVNGLCWETKNFGGHAITYYYNRYVKPNGTLKVRFDGGVYNTSRPISFAITDLLNFSDYGNYSDSYQLPGISTTGASLIAEDADGYSGDVDMVLWVNLSSNYINNTWYNVSVYLVHEGFDLLVAGIPIFVTDGAPSAWDENSTGYERSSPCSSSVDEDLNYFVDCADLNCNGSVGGSDCTGGSAVCEFGSEFTCYDCFDNDRNSRYDCADSSCDLKPGAYYNLSIMCNQQGEGSSVYDLTVYPWTFACADLFNNDQEDNVDCWDTTYCWGRGNVSAVLPCPAFENNTALWCHDFLDNNYNHAVDCADYDCRGVYYANSTYNATCPLSEAFDKFGNFVPLQCFDNIDNNLNSPTRQYTGIGPNIDCADITCTGITNPVTNVTCFSNEYNLSLNISADYCRNVIDDDADNYKGWPFGGIDCSDPDCNQQFGLCGPCPAVENISWNSCANSIDDNTNMPVALKDCKDPNCLGEIGSVISGQRCTVSENSIVLCSDEFDNDANGVADCLDANCNLLGYCEYNAELTCNDEKDNDANGLIDCADPDCFGAGCSVKNWSTVGCTVVPANSSWSSVGSTSVRVRHLFRQYVDSSYSVEFSGTGSYASLTLTVGDATNSSLYFPYNASGCVLSGDTSKVKWVASQGEVGQLQDNGSFSGGFNAVLTCGGLPSAQVNLYDVLASNELQGGATENGELRLTATVYENVAPVVSLVEIAPVNSSNATNIDYGGSFKLRGIPNNDSSGICQCVFNASGSFVSNGDCIYSMPVTDDAVLSISAAARDGAYNLGSYGGLRQISLNVLPVQNSISVSKAQPFYNITENLTFSSSFTAASSGSINSCLAFVEDFAGTVVASKPVIPAGGSCNNGFDLSAFADGLYYLVVNATDEDGDTVTSDKKVFYVCSSYNSSGLGWTCAKADFKQSGSPDLNNCTFNPQYDVNLNLFVTLMTSNSSNKTILIYENSTHTLMAENTTDASNITFSLPAGIYDVYVDGYADLGVRFFGISLTEDSNYSIYLDRLSSPVYGLKTFAVDADVNMSYANVVMNYSDANYTYENLLAVGKCDDWNLEERSCNGSWNSIPAEFDYFSKTATASVSGFSGFSISQGSPGGGSSGGGGSGRWYDEEIVQSSPETVQPEHLKPSIPAVSKEEVPVVKAPVLKDAGKVPKTELPVYSVERERRQWFGVVVLSLLLLLILAGAFWLLWPKKRVKRRHKRRRRRK